MRKEEIEKKRRVFFFLLALVLDPLSSLSRALKREKSKQSTTHHGSTLLDLVLDLRHDVLRAGTVLRVGELHLLVDAVHRSRNAGSRGEHGLVGGGDVGVGGARRPFDEAGGAGCGLEEGLGGLEKERWCLGEEEEAREREKKK